MNDAIAFMRWERIVPWKILSLKAYENKRPVPVGFGSNDRNFPKKLKEGSQIWVVTKILSQWSLAGRVVVTNVYERDSKPKRDWPMEIFDLCEQWEFVAMSDCELDHPKSEFFETNRAEPARARLSKAKSGFGFTQGQTVMFRGRPLKGLSREKTPLRQKKQTFFSLTLQIYRLGLDVLFILFRARYFRLWFAWSLTRISHPSGSRQFVLYALKHENTAPSALADQKIIGAMPVPIVCFQIMWF